MNIKDKFEVIFKILTIIELAILILITIKLNTLYQAKNDLTERIKQLEIDYKIYELNLQNLEENKEVQFEQRRN